jgi:hypothetical protein
MIGKRVSAFADRLAMVDGVGEELPTSCCLTPFAPRVEAQVLKP